uniref:Transposase Tc1-like domain-containing protein n=1 Tax=Paramormyrops kingsleyae TaxID=1676925 RepID=A0A3B3QNQ0_9TELE
IQHYQHLTEFDRGGIVGLHEARWSYHAIAQHVGHADVTVARCWNQWAGEGTHIREGSGRPRQTTPREDRRQALQNPMTLAPATRTQVLDSLQHPLPLLRQHPGTVFQ